MRVACDSNIIVYVEGAGDSRRCEIARSLIRSLDPESVVVPVQAIGEAYNVLVKKKRWPSSQARATVVSWLASYNSVGTDATVMGSAVEIADRHRLSIWDAVMLAIASQAGCTLLLTEDMQDGFQWRGVTIVNPFAAEPNPAYARLIASRSRESDS